MTLRAAACIEERSRAPAAEDPPGCMLHISSLAAGSFACNSIKQLCKLRAFQRRAVSCSRQFLPALLPAPAHDAKTP